MHIRCPLVVFAARHAAAAFATRHSAAAISAVRDANTFQVIEMDADEHLQEPPGGMDLPLHEESPARSRLKLELLWRAAQANTFGTSFFMWMDPDVDREGFFRSRSPSCLCVALSRGH